ncbi:MAG: hypothetical protein D6721_01580 [Gammaproteobacteria bacterium]|nr:MAG: hypothetical protein D6721_01580 [Gammaproteobacteria bacterium]
MYNLDTDEMANLFHRGLGIAWFDVLRDRNGMISVSAQMGFKKQRIDDAIAYFEQHKTIQTASKDTGKEKSGN